tara:strand:- start:40061 stop:40954 length:894 start_codon:yes stop_codon:yes gene_type:complete
VSYKAGYVGLIGLPNAGKSTMANALVGEKIAIVSRKAQTTRKRVLGIISNEDYQIVLADAPGVIQSHKGMNGYIMGEYHDVIETSDVLIAVLNPDAHSEEAIDKILALVQKSGKPYFAVITKLDDSKIHRVEKIKYKLRDAGISFYLVSALKRPEQLREDLIPEILKHMPESPGPFFDPELFTTSSMREMVEEVVREKCFEFLHDELPYGLAVQVRKYEEGDRLDKIYADILIEKSAHKQMVIGKKAHSIKRIGTLAREEIEQMAGKKIHLDLHVKVKEAWTSNKSSMRELGYVHQS